MTNISMARFLEYAIRNEPNPFPYALDPIDERDGRTLLDFGVAVENASRVDAMLKGQGYEYTSHRQSPASPFGTDVMVYKAL
jgi:hypothetical protein